MTNATEKAQELLGGRITVVGDLESASARLDDLRAQIESAERAVSEAWNAATGAGWTPRELRTLGFKEPRARRSAKRTRTSSARSAAGDAGASQSVPDAPRAE